jgi:predicted nucleic acid-binding protein
VTSGLLDTSVFIALEKGRPIEVSELPITIYIPMITYAELQTGLLTAPSPALISCRLQTLDYIAKFKLFDITKSVASKWSVLRANLLSDNQKANINDLWIAAIALEHGLPVYSRDGDYDVIAEYGGPESIRV